MKKFILIFVLLSSFIFSSTIDTSAKKNINDTLSLLRDKDANVVNKLLTSSDAVYGEYISENYRYIYKLKASGGDRIGIFIIQEIYNEDYPIIKQFDMKQGFVILINGHANKKVIYAGNMNIGGGGDTSIYDYVGDKQIKLNELIKEYFNSKNTDNSVYDYDDYIFSVSENGKITIDFTKSDSLAYAYIYSLSRESILKKTLLHRDKVSINIKPGFYKLTLRSQGKISEKNTNFPYQFTLLCKDKNNNTCSSLNDDYGNDFSNAKVIKKGEEITANINSTGDIDFFKINITKEGFYDTSLIGKSTTINFYNEEKRTVNGNCRNTEIGKNCHSYLRTGNYYLTFQYDHSNDFVKKYNFILKCNDTECEDSDYYLDLPFTGSYQVTQGNNDEEHSHHIYDKWDNTYAIDFATPLNTSILAPADGEIVCLYDEKHNGGKTCGIEPKNGCLVGGRVMVLRDKNDNYLTFLHLNSFSKEVGDIVNRGETIAHSGNSKSESRMGSCLNRASTHLHFHLWTGTGTPDSHTTAFTKNTQLRVKVDESIKYLYGDELDDNKIYPKVFESLQ